MTQFWPEVDDFSNDASVPWEFPDRYILVDPAAGDETSDSVVYTPQVGALYRRVNASSNPTTVPQAGFSSLLGQTTSTTGKTSMGCVLERSIVLADVDVSAEFELEVFPETVSPNADSNFLRGYFIWARVAEGAADDGSAATFVPGSKFPGILYPRGLFFGHVKPPTGPDQFVLGHLTQGGGGGITVDFKVDVQDVAGIGSNFGQVGGPFLDDHLNQIYGFYKPEKLRMRCDGTRVRCYAKMRGGTVGAMREILVFDETTSETQAGRCGLCPQLVVRNSPTQGYSLMHSRWFQIKAAGSSLLFRDEWSRINHKWAYRIPQDTPDVRNGPSLMSAFTGDGFGTTTVLTGTFPHHFHLEQDAANDSLTLGRDIDAIAHVGGLNQNYGFYISQQINFTEALSDVNQRRYAEFGIDTTNDWELGIALRMSFFDLSSIGYNFRAEDASGSPHDTLKQGYLAVVSSESGSFEIRIDRYNLQPVPGGVVTIARASISDPVSPATFTLEFESRRGSIAGTGQTFTSLRVKYNDVVQTLIPETSEYESVDNWINDTTAEHIPSGFGTGFYYQRDSDSFEDDAVSVGNFSRLAPTVAETEVPPQNQASIAMPAENANKSGSLTLPLSVEISEIPCSSHRSGGLATGFRYSSPRYSQSRKRWSAAFSGVTYAEGQSFLDLLESNGWTIPFDWTRADTGEAFEAKLVGGSVTVRYDHQAGTLDARFEMDQVFGQEAYN